VRLAALRYARVLEPESAPSSPALLDRSAPLLTDAPPSPSTAHDRAA